MIERTIRFALLVFFLCGILSATYSNAQNFWRVKHSKASTSELNYRQVFVKQSVSADQNAESITVISRNSTVDESTITSTTQSFDANGVLAGSTPLTTISTIDNLTGQTLVTYHGANNQDKTFSSYDALGRMILLINHETGLAKNEQPAPIHVTEQVTQYQLSANGMVKSVSQLPDSYALIGASKPLITHITHFDGLGRQTYTTDSRHQNTDGSYIPTGRVTYNDLGQIAVKTDLLGNTQAMHYDALGEQTQSVKTITHPAQGQAAGFTQTVIVRNAIDHVANTKTSQQQAVITFAATNHWQSPTIIPCGAQHTNKPNDQCTGKTITQLDDQGQVTQQVSQGSKVSTINGDATAQAFITQHQYDNFGDKQQDTLTLSNNPNNPTAITPLVTQFTFDAMGKMAHATTQKRNSKEQDINVDFSNNLQGTLVGKTVNGKTPYLYTYGAAGNILEEIRYDLKANDGRYINQRYIYSDNGYTVKRTAWSPNNTTGKTVEINHYGDVDGKKALLSQWTPDATITTDYDYNLGKPLSVQQTPSNDAAAKTDPSSMTTYQYDDTADNSGQVNGHLLSQRNDNGQTIRYRYYSPQDKIMPDALKSRTVFVGTPQNGTPLTGIETTYHATQAFNGSTISTRTQVDQVTPSLTLATEPVLIQPLVSVTTRKNAQGNVTGEDRKNSNGVTTDQKLITYDNYSRPVQILFKTVSNTANDTLMGGVNYTYKQDNNSTRQLSCQTEYSKQDDKQIKTDYRYDNGNRLADVRRLDTNYSAISNDGDFTKSTETTNTYDAMNNLQDRYIAPDNAMGDGQYKHYHYVYDGYNQVQRIETNELTTQNTSWDINGNMTSDEYGTKRKFDKENHEVDTIVNAQQGKNSSIDVHNQWANGLRLTQSVQGVTFHYQYLNGQLLDTQVQATGKDITQNGWFSVYATPTIRVISRQDGSIQDIQNSDTGSDNSVYYTRQSKSGNTVLTKQNNVYHYNANGNLVDSNTQQTSTLDIRQPTKLFHGGLHDLVTKEDYRRVRFITTHRGGMRQFTSRDFGQKLVNLDGFANENAVVYGDPSGHMGKKTPVVEDVFDDIFAIFGEEEAVLEGAEYLAGGGLGELFSDSSASLSSQDEEKLDEKRKWLKRTLSSPDFDKDEIVKRAFEFGANKHLSTCTAQAILWFEAQNDTLAERGMPWIENMLQQGEVDVIRGQRGVRGTSYLENLYADSKITRIKNTVNNGSETFLKYAKGDGNYLLASKSHVEFVRVSGSSIQVSAYSGDYTFLKEGAQAITDNIECIIHQPPAKSSEASFIEVEPVLDV